MRQPLPTLFLLSSKSRAISDATRIQPCEARAIHILPFPARSQFLPGRLVEMGIRQTRATHLMQAGRPRALTVKQPKLTAG